jgi:hypothetical protein
VTVHVDWVNKRPGISPSIFYGGMMKARGRYTVKKWNETTYDQISPGMKMTRASVEYAFSGEIAGNASVEYLMFYRHFDEKDQHASSASYAGLIRFMGTLEGRQGSFVMKDDGGFEGGTADSVLQICDGSGTGSLAGIRGSGMYRADKNGCQCEIDFTLA